MYPVAGSGYYVIHLTESLSNNYDRASGGEHSEYLPNTYPHYPDRRKPESDTPLPIRFVSAEHTTIIGRLIDHNLCIHVPVYKLFAQQTNGAGYFPVRCRTAFLLRTDPVPVSVRLIERTDIVELDAIVLFYSLHYISQKTSVLS